MCYLNMFMTSRNVNIFNIKRSLALFPMLSRVQIWVFLSIILGISSPVFLEGSCPAYNTCMTKYAHTCKYLFDLLGYSITLIGAPFVLCKSRASCTNGYCTVFYVFIRNVSCHTLCFCFIILQEADPNFFSIMYINTNHIIGSLQIFSFFLFFYIFCSYFLTLFYFSCYLFDEHMTTYDCYLSNKIHVPCYMNKYPICSTFMMALVTYVDFELLDNG